MTTIHLPRAALTSQSLAANGTFRTKMDQVPAESVALIPWQLEEPQ
jgi:hypothetical protein